MVYDFDRSATSKSTITAAFGQFKFSFDITYHQ